MNIIDHKREPIEFVLPIIAVTFSLASVLQSILTLNYFSILVSIIGIVAGILFFTKNKHFRLLINIWIYAQFPAIFREVESITESGLTLLSTINIVNAPQFFSFPFLGADIDGLNLKLTSYHFYI